MWGKTKLSPLTVAEQLEIMQLVLGLEAIEYADHVSLYLGKDGYNRAGVKFRDGKREIEFDGKGETIYEAAMELKSALMENPRFYEYYEQRVRLLELQLASG